MSDSDDVQSGFLEVPLDPNTLTLVIGPMQRVIIVDDVLTPEHVLNTLELVMQSLRDALNDFEREVLGG
jgi:hypothetical protein